MSLGFLRGALIDNHVVFCDDISELMEVWVR